MSNIPARAIIRPSRGVIIATLVVAALLAAEVSRLTVATAFAESRPELARRLAPQLPEVLVYDAMAQVGQSAAQGQPPPQSTMETLRLLSRVAPLRSEPLLVQAAIAHRGGDPSLAERLLLEARRRNPRSAAARYLLADV
jgi:type II secretory pathway component HofQ